MYSRLLLVIVATAFVEQAVITVARVTTTYRALELDLSVVWIGVVTAAYAVLPIGIGIPMGRFIDRGYDAVTTWIGGGLLVVSCACFVLFPNLIGIMVATSIMGTAHLLFVVSQQIQCTRCGSGPGAMERAIGNYMVANAVGQGVGPYIVGLAGGSASVPPTDLLFELCLGGAVLTAALALLTQSSGTPKVPPGRAKVPLRELLFIPGLNAIMLVSCITVVAQDLIVVYLPLLGADRGLSVDAVGTVLAIRAIASMVSRLLYARLQFAFGRVPLTIASSIVSALSYAAVALPLPRAFLYVAVAVAGFSLSVAMTASIAGVLAIATGGAIGTANSLRTMVNRVAQFFIPIMAGAIATAIGTGSIFVLLGIGLAASGVAVHFDTRQAKSE
ncbi:MAG TPA: MFS transporter [Xanthobacteraceae bacterium]|nr:MFS transporter [Xanthobacteraceae bacterium]